MSGKNNNKMLTLDEILQYKINKLQNIIDKTEATIPTDTPELQSHIDNAALAGYFIALVEVATFAKSLFDEDSVTKRNIAGFISSRETYHKLVEKD